MEIEVKITADNSEVGDVMSAIAALQDETTVEMSERDRLSGIEEAALRAVQGPAKGSALKSIHRSVAEIEDSIEWTEEWSDERVRVQDALGSLRQKDLIRLQEKSYYPADSE